MHCPESYAGAGWAQDVPHVCVCRSFSYEEFIATQDKFQKQQAETLCVLNEEVARAIEDVISLVQVSHCIGRVRIVVQPD